MVVPRISILVPVLNERALLPGFFAHVMQRMRTSDFACELIFIDGASTDGSQGLIKDLLAENQEIKASNAQVFFLESRGGRYQQLNAGVALARAAMIVCCSVDLRLSAKALAAIDLAQQHAVTHGCLRQHSTRAHYVFKVQDLFARLRARWMGNAYMDQLPFFRRDLLLRAQGFSDCGAYDTANLCRRIGRRHSFRMLSMTVVSSCRGWHDGFIRQTMRHQLLRLKYWWSLLR